MVDLKQFRYEVYAIKDRHNSRRTKYRAATEKRSGKGKGNWGSPLDFFEEDIPVNEPFEDGWVDLKPPAAEDNKIKVVSSSSIQ
jgi:hypothetical protein